MSWLESSLCPTSSWSWLTSDSSSWHAMLISMFLATSALYCCSSCCSALPSASCVSFLCLLMLSLCWDSLSTSSFSLKESGCRSVWQNGSIQSVAVTIADVYRVPTVLHLHFGSTGRPAAHSVGNREASTGHRALHEKESAEYLWTCPSKDWLWRRLAFDPKRSKSSRFSSL